MFWALVCFWQAVWQLNEEVKEHASEGQGLPIREGVVYLHTKSPHPYPVQSICQSLVSSTYPTVGTHAVLAIQTDPLFWSIYGKFKRATLLKVFPNVLDTYESPFCPVISYVNCKPRRSVVGFHGTVDVANCALRSGKKRRSVGVLNFPPDTAINPTASQAPLCTACRANVSSEGSLRGEIKELMKY